MKIGLTADNYSHIPVSIILRMLRWMGVDFSEVTINIFSHPKRALRSSRGMKLGLHLPNIGNCGFDFSCVEQKDKVESALNTIKRYEELFDFQYTVFHIPEKDSNHDAFEFYLHNLRQIETPLVLENIIGWSPEQFFGFYRRLKVELGEQIIGMCLDVPHAYISRSDWKAFFLESNLEVKVIHLSDCNPEEDLHLPFGLCGSLDLDKILTTLYNLEFNGVINFEIKPTSLRNLNVFFNSYLQAKAIFQPEGIGKIQKRMQIISLIGRIIGLLFRY